MRKKAIKKRLPNRGKSFKILREHGSLHEYIDRRGNVIYLNPMKHFLLLKEYKNLEYVNYLFRIIKQYHENMEVK